MLRLSIMERDGAEENHSDNDRAMYIDAEEVFVLMTKTTRVSRNIRACWFFRNLKHTVRFRPSQELHLEDLRQDLTLAALIPADGEPMLDPNQTYNVGISPRTTVTFLASRYCIAFTLDLSPSVMAVDVVQGRLVCEEVFQNFCKCLQGLVRPFHLPGSQILFVPKLFITVLAYSPLVYSLANQVMVQGVSVSQDNVNHVIQYVHDHLIAFENALSVSFIKLLENMSARRAEHQNLTEEEEAGFGHKVKEEMLGSPEVGFVDMLRCGILALQMLPANSSSGIVVVTDGLVGVPEANFLESLLMQLRNSTISCTFLKAGSSLGVQQQLGHVPFVELMQFIATATFGGYFAMCPDVAGEDSKEPNVYHQALFYWSFQKGLEGYYYKDVNDDPDVIGSPSWMHKQLYSHPLRGRTYGLDVLRKKHQERLVQVGLNGVLSVRLREGYTIREVHFLKGGSEIEVKLLLPWRDYGKIEYNATAAWPLDKNKAPTKVEIYLEGSYDFLHEITCNRGQIVKSPYRTASTKKFWHLLQNISQTDQLLMHLQSFDSNSAYYEVPDSIRSGVPLFVLDPVNPVLNSQLNTKEPSLAQFASFWRPVLMLDTNIWQKWVHSHRIGLVLEQDLPLPRYLHVPNSSGRFNILQCRQALASLTQHLRDWATFVLAENHSYIKLLYRQTDKAPTFFCMLRLIAKPPSVILRLAFLGGTPNNMRRHEVQILKEELAELKFPQRNTQKSDKKPALKLPAGTMKEKERKAPLLREWSEINCCTILQKPVEKILIRYEEKPEDISTAHDSLGSAFRGEGLGVGGQAGMRIRPVHSKFNTLSHYLLHYRWVWSVQLAASVPVSLSTISKMLQTLTKIRLQEGFHFAAANSGISNMVLEVDMMDNSFTGKPLDVNYKEHSEDEHQTCVLQYIVFPPHNKTSVDSVSEEDTDEMETTEADGEVQIVTECWIEPQFGVCVNNTPERLHFEGLTATELAKAFFPVDYECISSLTTFNYLTYLCQRDSNVPNIVPDIIKSGQASPPTSKWRHSQTEEDGKLRESTISLIPFPFDLLTLLPRCQQAELIFSTYSIARGKSAEQDSNVDPKGSNELLFSLLYEKFKEIHDQEVSVSADECTKFVDLLLKRERDISLHPFPFKCSGFADEQIDRKQQQTHDDRQETDGGDTTDAGGPDITGDRVKSVTTGKENNVTTSVPNNSPPGARAQLQNATSAIPLAQSSSGLAGIGSLQQNQAMWRCFVKATSSTQMIVTFLPASYDDLLLLNSQKHPEEELAENACSTGNNTGATVTADVVESASGWSGEAEDWGSRRSNVKQDEMEISQSNTGDLESNRVIVPSSVPTACDDTYSLTAADMSGGEAVLSVATSAGDKAPPAVITVTKASPGQSPERTIPLCREEDIKEWVKTSSSVVQPQVKGPLLIPIYVYDCIYNNVIESLVNRWTFTLQPDIYEDLSFVSETGDKHHIPTFMDDSQSSFDVRENVISEKEDGDFSRSNGRMSLDRRSNDSSYEGANEYKRHVQHISEAFFNCFVTGLYQSLHHHFFVDKSDIEAAISSICEETLEIDMTTFLLASCSHMQHLTSQVRRKMAATQDGDLGPSRHSVRFMEIVDIESNDGDLVVPEILQLPYGMVPLLPSVFADTTCEYTPGLHQLVQDKFLEIVRCWFKPVPSLPDYYFYSLDLSQHNSMGENFSGNIKYKGETSDGNLDQGATEAEFSTKAGMDEDDGDIVMAEFYDDERKATKCDLSAVSNLDDSISDDELNMTSGLNKKNLAPLFVHFTCTLKRRTQHHNISVTSLPQCLGEILSCFEEPLLAVDLGEIKMTLDINCLTLPVDTEHTSPGKSLHMDSHSNQSHNRSSKSSESDIEDLHSTSASDCGEYTGDSMNHLPRVQQEAVMKFKSEVEWLFYDEVASALRHLHPLNADALEFVMRHVSSSSSRERPSIVHQEISLLFVYGTQRSMQLFVEEFERMSIPGYRLNKLKGYYYLAIDRAHADSIRHAQALKTALVELSLGNAGCGEDEAVLNSDGRKLFPTMEERSYSLPSILPSAQTESATGRTMCEAGGNDRTGNGSSEDNRPRSSSDAKFFKERNHSVVTYFADSDLHSATARDKSVNSKSGIDPPLHKSNSFAGLQEPIPEPPSTCSDTQSGSKVGSSPLASIPGVRSRHFSAPSGQGTPQSLASTIPQTPSVVSSHGSGTSDAGFEGDVSDADVDDTVSVSDAGVSFPRLPSFWLILQIHNNRVELFFQTRTHSKEELDSKIQKSLLRRISKLIEDICQKVNKQLLLNELYETRMCNSLLVPAAVEDMRWTDPRTFAGRSMLDASEVDDEDESEEGKDHGYLEAALIFEPGYFACDCMWRKLFVLHPRLKAGTQKPGPSRGLLALHNVLNKFSVNNRNNMFVIQEASSRNVFYLRLKEISLSNMNEPPDIQVDLEASLSDFSVHTLKPDSKLDSDTRSEGDTVSVMSGYSRLSSRIEDMVELTAHGIEEPGKEIQEDLMKLLQNRLDDTVVDVISLMLSRNPQCKLRPEDVQFIQNMEQDATETFQLTIPSHAMQYLSALICYLKQNLLQFLHPPNYLEESPDCHFQDIVQGKRSNIPSDQVYLYISPQSGGRKGIACVICSLVDGCGNPVKLLGCPRPSSLSTLGHHNAESLPQMVETSLHTTPATSWGPGPTALIQFRIWQRGSLDLRQLRDRLTTSVCHSLCDLVMEFFLLTASTCSLPSGLQDQRTLPVASLPSSPVFQKKDAERKQQPLGRKLSDSANSLSIRPVPHSASPFQTLHENFSPRTHLVSPSLGSSQSFDWSQVQAISTPALEASLHSSSSALGVQQEKRELQELVVQYEQGEKGTLHRVFSSLMEPWMQFCYKQGLPSVSKVELNLQAEFSVEYIFHELLSSVPTISNSVTLRLFKVLHYSNPHQAPMSIHYSPCRPQQMTLENQVECVIDRSELGHVKLIAVGRDYAQWCSTVERELGDLKEPSPAFFNTTTKTLHGSQKFASFWQEGSKEKIKGGIKFFTPRQHLLFITAYDKKLTVYMYNWAGDQGAVLEKTVRRLVQWHNARAHILASIISQKMGLFHHNMFDEVSHTVEQNPYTQTSNDLESLVRHTAPPRDVQRRHSSLSAQSRSFSHVLNQTRPFDQTYSNLQPVRPLQRAAYGNLQDPVSSHGMQVLEIRSRFRKDAERLMKLRQLYGLWWQKTSPNTPVTEDYLAILKKSSRLFHYCATPLLFCQQWRQYVLEQNAATADIPPVVPPPPPPSPEKEPTKSRSRHSSGTLASSGRRKRSLSQDAGRGKKILEAQPFSQVEVQPRKSAGPTPDDPWHQELCHSFLMQYCNYLTTEFGFVRLNLQPGLPKRGSGLTTMQNSGNVGERFQQHLTVNLQKTLTAGIILMELSLHGQYFFLKMFVFDCLHTLGINPNQQMKLLFVDECEKYRDLIHVHSFAHDFHLRCVHHFLRVNSSIFHPGFHLSNFLADFLQIYPVPPTFSRNCLAQETMQIQELPCPGPQLFSYMQNQIRQFSMTALRMTPSEPAVEPDYCYIKGDEFALVQTCILQPTHMEEGVNVEEERDAYNMALIITHDIKHSLPSQEMDLMMLRIKFYVVLTRQRDCHPKRTLEKKFGDFRQGSQGHLASGGCSGVISVSGGSDIGAAVAVKQHLGVRQEHINYLGYSNIHQTYLYTLLNTQVQAGRDKVQEMVELSKVKCRRDYLWHRMTTAVLREDVRKKGKITEEAVDLALTPLTFVEFGELLDLVCLQALPEVDSRLMLFGNMPTTWYASLLPVLISRFPSNYRCFTSPDSHLQHMVILNRNWLDMCILLSIDRNTGCTAFCSVTREPYVESEEREDSPSLLLRQMYSLIEDFVSACCFHLWTTVL
ncbi:KICSTOR complex protein SZT2-like isoform X3 [Pomacea canaliculata]|uniref:KICSTOR complex protein SZT2-like isoform X3 n=1 Tax=Pomacea canaliculata TaxID=400727 RepID=UPI000D737E50|nr:KICSTOR complex protein SZT2-like isoform X3 [Pomacea canaliculata]